LAANKQAAARHCAGLSMPVFYFGGPFAPGHRPHSGRIGYRYPVRAAIRNLGWVAGHLLLLLATGDPLATF